jgi:hypothetical protein
MCCSCAIITNILGPFPKGQKVWQFAAFEHTNAQHLHINTTSPWTYHYQWAHECPLGPSYLGGFNKNSCYSGKQYSIKQVAFVKHLGLKLKYTPHQLALTGA